MLKQTNKHAAKRRHTVTHADKYKQEDRQTDRQTDRPESQLPLLPSSFSNKSASLFLRVGYLSPKSLSSATAASQS